ncbi:unnamed protein product [Schistosoma margrebowiei]|uniref:Uncharacterized protein n=1 Tax=Schistosoma margrebowiei TaxID=48269 RepID=A0A183MKV1_9TREM|nr:unnamed protein product [Schistosoma margrebowiei]
MQNTSDPLAKHYQQPPTVRENKPDPGKRRSQEELLEMDRIHIEESTQLHHKTSSHMEPSRPKERRKTKEHIKLVNRNRHEKNEQELDGTRKEVRGQSGLENAAPLEVTGITSIVDLYRMIGGQITLDGNGVTNQLTSTSHLMVNILRGLHQGTIDALKTIQHKGRYYRNILVKVDTSESKITAACFSPWHKINGCAFGRR